MKRILLALPLLSLLSGCSSPEEQAITLMEEMANIIDSNKEDCDKMAAALDTFATKNGETLKKLQETLKGGDEAKEKAMKEKYGARLGAIMGKMMEGSMKCAANEKVAAAMAKLN